MLVNQPPNTSAALPRLLSTSAALPRLLSTSASGGASAADALLQQCCNPLLLHQQLLIRGLLLPPNPDPFYWNQIIRAYLAARRPAAALLLARSLLRLPSPRPDHFTFPFLLKACALLPSLRRGAALHALTTRTAFLSSVFVSNSLISMYARCGALHSARQVFDETLQSGIADTISWNSISAAYSKSGSPLQALQLFRQRTGSGSDIIGLVNILPALAKLKAKSHAKEVHCYAVRNGMVTDLFVGNAMIDVYAKCAAMGDALRVFDGMPVRDVVSWNAMVTGYSQNGGFEDALMLFERMRGEGVELNVVTWSAVIAGYAQKGRGYRAMGVFREMQAAGVEANSVTIISLLSACASAGALSQGMETHGHVIRTCLDDDGGGEDFMVQNALVDMYSKCKLFGLARVIFDSVPLDERTVVTWTVMIGGFAQHGDANAALELFSEMILKSSFAVPNDFTISCVLMACARLSALRNGKQIHAYVIRNQYDVLHVANCLIDMYNKCGDLNAARNVFGRMPLKNAVSWTSLLTGSGMHGKGDDVLRIFEEMQKVGFVPDGITFLVLLYACSHCGMVDQGVEYFNSMGRVYGVTAGSEHYACMVDLLGRAGRLDEAWKMIQSMPMKATAVVWVSLLSACRTHANVELGEYAAAGLQELESDNDGSYTLLSNIYANAGRWKDVARIRSLMKKTGIRKRPGCSWIQGSNGTATFCVGDRSHAQSQQIYELLGSLIERIRAIGYVPQTHFALHDVDDEEKSSLLFEHSEKLALAFGILTSSPGMPIRITKNLRVCGDCHSAFTFISMIVNHEIILRDSSRFHHFKKGSCSCGGYW